MSAVLILLPLFIGVTAGCSSVPKEVVELSYVVGQDVQALHESYRRLVTVHFDTLRAQRIHYFETRWKPRFISRWVVDGRLVDIASGKVVFDEDKDDYVPPTEGAEGVQLVRSVWQWADAAIAELEGKKQELVKPLSDDEQSILISIDDAFTRIVKGNATITAHLNSLRKVQEVQDDVLRSLNLGDLRNKINEQLAAASNRAQKAQMELEKLDR